MFKIKPLFFALLLSQTSASVRRLDEEKFLSYEPQTTVTDHAAIDLDQQAIEEQLAQGTEQGKTNALNVYTKGAFSKSYAQITLDTALTSAVPKGTAVTGQATDGTEIAGALLEEAAANQAMVKVQYGTTALQESYVGCQVGGNPQPVLDGCLQPTGTVKIGAMEAAPYTYDPATGNMNGRTIQGFSTGAKTKMNDCPKCPYKTYKKFYDYYQEYDYGNQWVLAAFNSAKADFTNGAADFTGYTGDGISEAVKKGTAYLNVWMYVNRELEDAIDDCENECATEDCNDDQVHAWDEAVAFYTGSIPKKSGDGGVLLYTLAQKRCENFYTCLQEGQDAGTAGVNQKIFDLFNAGKQHLKGGECAAAETAVNDITAVMTIPLVQGTLRYAHIIGEQNGFDEKAEAEGASFAAAVLPILHACNPSDAQTVYDNMKTGSGTNKNFAAVKTAFENNYDCMEIQCADVGGLLQADGETYFPGAEPCGAAPSTTSSSGTGGSSGGESSGGDSADEVVVDPSSAFDLGVGLALGITGAIAALF